ncbi:MAG TPA: hypothetical protein VJ813_04710 [Vicinamibacterales bacterium]|nr:hypothetical protein [Vicinamibacterales bacterium]
MTTLHPPRFAMWLLGRFAPGDEALEGDLLEEFAVRRSRWWLWRQVLAAGLVAMFRTSDEIRPLRLVDGDPGTRFIDPRRSARRTVNLTASPLPGIGGLGLLALAGLVTVVSPASWWIVVLPILGGIALGVAWIAFDRHRAHSAKDPKAGG